MEEEVEIISNKFNEKNEIAEKIKWLGNGSFQILQTSPHDNVKKTKLTSKNIQIGLSDYHLFICKYKIKEKKATVWE